MKTHVSVFAGAGMIDLAAETCGFSTVHTIENDPYCDRVLAARFPNAIRWGDVSGVNGMRDLPPRPDLVSGGFPCIDVSVIGHGRGLEGAHSGLWFEMSRLIREAEPWSVLIENVAGLRSRGAAAVISDLYWMGYQVRWDCISASYVGAPHRRDRMWISAVNAGIPYCVADVSGKLPRSGYVDESGTVRALASYPVTHRHHLRLPTPRRAANEWRTTRNAPSHGKTHGATLAGTLNDMERAAGRTPQPSSESAGNIRPETVEWVMGLPPRWTDDRPHTHLDHPQSVLRQPMGWGTTMPYPYTQANAYERRNRLAILGNGAVPAAAAIPHRHLADVLDGTADLV